MVNLKFSAIFQPTALFSLKDSKSTNSGAKSLLLPSPYAIKMAILNQAITLDGIDFGTNGKKNEWFNIVRDVEIGYYIEGSYCVNNCFIKILKPSRSLPGQVQETVSFREYIHINKPIEIIFEVKEEKEKVFLQKYIHKINYFGKRGCFFQFIEYKEEARTENVICLGDDALITGIIQEYDDFKKELIFEQVSSFSSKVVKRESKLFILPLERSASSKGFTHYRKN